MNESIQLGMWEAFKSLLALVQQQQVLITMTRHQLDDLTVALAKQFDWERPQLPSEPDPQMQARLDAGIAELERMLGCGDGAQDFNEKEATTRYKPESISDSWSLVQDRCWF
jgi:hypothetical protein